MKSLRILLALALLCAFALPATAKTFPHQAGGVEITIPDDWKEDIQGETLTAASPDGAVGLSFMMLGSGKSDKVGEALDKELEKTFGAEIEWDSENGTEEKINGMDCWYWVGAAKPKEGDPIVVLAWVIYTPTDKELLCYVGVDAASMEKHKAALEGIVDGIKPLAGAKTAEPTEEEGDDE